MAHQEFSDDEFVDLVVIEPPVDEQDKDDDCEASFPSRKEKLQALQITMHYLDV